MNAVEMVALALAAGATAGVQNTASAAGHDAYTELKGVLKRQLKDPNAGQALTADETEPGVWETVLTGTGAAEDQYVLAAAQHLLALADARGTAAGRYRVHMRGAKGVQVGDHNTQHNTFS